MIADTLPKLLKERVKELGDNIALREKALGIWRPITWSEYFYQVEIFCLGLKSLGLEREDRVSILADNCPQWLYADLAIQSVGGVSVGVYPTNTAVRVQYILDNSESKYVIVKDQEQLDKVLEIKDELPFLRQVIVIDMKGVGKYVDPIITSYSAIQEIGEGLREKDPTLFGEMISETKAEDIAVMVYTSGTTGPPKGSMLSHKNITAVVDSFFKVVPLYQTDSLVSVLPLCHVAERLFSLFMPMKAGCTINFAESVSTLQPDMIEISPTIFLTVPRILQKIHSTITIKMQDAGHLKRWVYNLCLPIGGKIAELEMGGQKVGLLDKTLYCMAYYLVFRHLRNRIGLLQVRECFYASAPLSVDIIKFFYSIGVRIKGAYGLTESTGVATMERGKRLRVGSAGKPIPGIQLDLASDGEIMVKGDMVFEGYHNDKASTARVKKNGWLYTGDVGEFDEEENLYIVDRKKEIIITASGKNISPSEIENSLKFSPYVNEAIVIGEGKKYLTVLIQIDYENVANWALKRDIPFTNYKSLARSAEVRTLIDREVQSVNNNFSRAESIKNFTILEKELDQDDDELTATMKVRREMIEKRYKELIDKMY